MLRHLAPSYSALFRCAGGAFFYAFFVLLLAGCSVDSQQVNPRLDLDTNLNAQGQGQPVRISVEDARASQTLGSRTGGASDAGALVLSSEEIRPRLLAQANKAVRLLGFTPSNRTDAAELRVILADLKYRLPRGTGLKTDVDVAATLRGVVQQPDGRRYSGSYSATMQQSFAAIPSEQSNTEIIGSVLSDALNRLFRDPMIAQTLRSR